MSGSRALNTLQRITGKRSSWSPTRRTSLAFGMLLSFLFGTNRVTAQEVPVDNHRLATGTINAVLGDASWLARYGEPPTASANEVIRIQTHLLFVAERLRAVNTAHLSSTQQRRRESAIAHLITYAARGVFPERTANDGYGPRRPRFIDDRGVHCAVGELIRATGHPALAGQIRDQFEYAYVPDIESSELLSWADDYGFSVTELTMIQPSYDGGGVEMPEDYGYVVQSVHSMFACAHLSRGIDSITLRVTWDRDNDMSVESRTRHPFARCYVRELQTDYRNRAVDGRSPFRRTLRSPLIRTRDFVVPILSPQRILESRLSAYPLTRYLPMTHCIPAPGPIPHQATVDVRLDRRGLDVVVVTSPLNEAVNQCLTTDIHHRLADLRLAMRQSVRSFSHHFESTLDTRVGFFLENRIQQRAPQAISVCTDGAPPPRVEIHATAQVDAEDLVVTVVNGTRPFRDCVARTLRQQIREDLTVRRVGENGTIEPYFRIDADATASHVWLSPRRLVPPVLRFVFE